MGPSLRVERTDAIMCVGAGHWPARKRAADSRPYEIQGGTSGFAVGADDLGGPRAHAVRPYRPIGMFQGG